ncbi:MAG TPA: hypothetical protein VK499_09415 [Propionibacteriaceae bacterium]|jgi:probable pyridine nucleotide-disulfide oxidoreductase|nr:hypothetical protein [Propionibacteriaceae bacterium]
MMSDRDVEDVELLMDRAKAGWKGAMVERDKIGGTCCVPRRLAAALQPTLHPDQAAGCS